MKKSYILEKIMNALYLRQLAGSEVVDYQFLMHALNDYQSPRAKITQLLKAGELIRVKKGLYVLSKDNQPETYSPEVLANLIYGPSYISTEYALAFYQLIPERVETITSLTSKKKDKIFKTPLGCFTYRYQNIKVYSQGFTQVAYGATGFLIATPEKALADSLYYKKLDLKNPKELKSFLIEDMRVDWALIQKFSVPKIKRIAALMEHPPVSMLVELLSTNSLKYWKK